MLAVDVAHAPDAVVANWWRVMVSYCSSR